MSNGTEVGMVGFNDKSFVLSEMMVINSEVDRRSLIDKMPSSTDLYEGRCIGCGIMEAVKVEFTVQ